MATTAEIRRTHNEASAHAAREAVNTKHFMILNPLLIFGPIFILSGILFIFLGIKLQHDFQAPIWATAPANTPKGDKPDREDIYGEVADTDHSGASELMMWALRSDYHYKWVELRAKPGEPGMLLVVRHTKPNPKLECTAGNAMN